MEVRKHPKSLRILFIAALVMIAGSLLLVLDDEVAIGLLGLAIFGTAAASIHLQLTAPPELVLTVDEQGLDYRPLGLGPIPWSEIREIRETRAPPVRFLSLILTDPAAHKARLDDEGRAMLAENAAFELPPFSICFSELEPDLDAVLAEIRRRHPEKLATEVVEGPVPGGHAHA